MENSAVWNAFVMGLQGEHVAAPAAQQRGAVYNMGRPADTVDADEDGADWTADVAEQPAKPVEQPAARTRKGTKAEVVRELIKAAKDARRNEAYVIAEVVEQLGMTKQLATAYVKNNWSRVPYSV